MEETLQELRKILREMWHRRWIGLLAAWLAALIAIAVVYRIPERYEATARVFVDTDTLLKPILAGVAIQPNVDQQVALLSRTLISRPNVEKVVRMSDLDLRAQTDAQRARIVDEVTRALSLTGDTRTNLYQISFRDPDPNQARRVVQSLLTLFVESSLGDKQADSRSAIKFLEEQIRHYESALQAAENRLKDFRLKYMGVGTQAGDGYFARLATLRQEIDNARLELQVAERQRDSYRKELSGEQPTFIPETAETVVESAPEIDARLATLRKELDEQRRKYTDSHPDVIATQRLIAQLEDQRKVELAERRKAMAGVGKVTKPTDRNPVFQQLRMSLAEAEAAYASAQAKLGALESQHGQLVAQAKLVPQVEAELAQLNRDYEVQKKTYETLLARREQATMGIGVQDSGGAQFRVIDPPRVSSQPVAPNRLMLLAMAAALSLGAGVLASFVASRVIPTFHDSRTLASVAQRPVLGMVSMLPSPGMRRRRRRRSLLFAGGLTGLFALFAAVGAFALFAWRTAAS